MTFYFWLFSLTDLSIEVLPGEQSPALAGTQFKTDLGDRSSIIMSQICLQIRIKFTDGVFCDGQNPSQIEKLSQNPSQNSSQIDCFLVVNPKGLDPSNCTSSFSF